MKPNVYAIFWFKIWLKSGFRSQCVCRYYSGVYNEKFSWYDSVSRICNVCLYIWMSCKHVRDWFKQRTYEYSFHHYFSLFCLNELFIICIRSYIMLSFKQFIFHQYLDPTTTWNHKIAKIDKKLMYHKKDS